MNNYNLKLWIHADSLLIIMMAWDSGNQDIFPGTEAVTHSDNPGIQSWVNRDFLNFKLNWVCTFFWVSGCHTIPTDRPALFFFSSANDILKIFENIEVHLQVMVLVEVCSKNLLSWNLARELWVESYTLFSYIPSHAPTPTVRSAPIEKIGRKTALLLK